MYGTVLPVFSVRLRPALLACVKSVIKTSLNQTTNDAVSLVGAATGIKTCISCLKSWKVYWKLRIKISE